MEIINPPEPQLVHDPVTSADDPMALLNIIKLNVAKLGIVAPQCGLEVAFYHYISRSVYKKLTAKSSNTSPELMPLNESFPSTSEITPDHSMDKEDDNSDDILSSPKQYVRANKRKKVYKNHGVMTSVEALSTSMAKK
ncbi:CLUMA_CG013077, isoform A [Clunio marinus]|uniref:CLUMA_CG013077, isoform A n=1 Tax=Clunio marinus TaxID=568069 RepID=A0A1J1IJQ3_9DIPT|nr:CLUMA_CG013077, isoform A [Clunio marinus]